MKVIGLGDATPLCRLFWQTITLYYGYPVECLGEYSGCTESCHAPANDDGMPLASNVDGPIKSWYAGKGHLYGYQ